MRGRGPPARIGEWRIDTRNDSQEIWARDMDGEQTAMLHIEQSPGGWTVWARTEPHWHPESTDHVVIPRNHPLGHREEAVMVARQWMRDHPAWPNRSSMSGFGIGLD